MNKRPMILCLGPNRTGTSAATAAIAALGADLGFVAVYANEENQKGFFEHPKLVEINEKILSALDGSWDSAAFVGRDALALANDRLIPLRSEALGFLRDSFSSATPALLKDPRLCLLLEFWLPVFKEAGFGKIDIVHILRDPAEAALSQQVRTIRRPEYYEVGRNLAEGAALWLAYMAQMWDRFADSRHILLSYDDLVDRPQDSLKRLGKFLALTPDAAQLGSFLDTFLDSGLRHSKPSQDLRAEVDAALPAAREVYDLLTPLCASGLLTPAIVGSVQSLALTAKPAVERLQSGVVARLSNAKRGFGSQHEFARVFAELAEQRQEFEADRDRIVAEYRAERQALDIEIAKILEEHKQWTAALLAENDRIVAAQSALYQLIVELNKAKSDLEVVAKANQIQAATAHAQLAHELLLIERDMQTVRQAEAETADKLIAIQQSRSWKITAPLRAAGMLLRQIGPRASGLWLWVNHVSRRLYRSLDRRSPWLAEQMRRMAVPVIRMGNRVVFRSDYVPTVQKISDSFADHVEFQFDYQLPRVADENPPLVTILVPNYNHAPYLRQRLDSIFAQTWTNFEVILMDDCSTDESREILEEYAARYSDKTRTIFNTENSGGAFYQWEKGLRAAKGDLIWVAESDDWCSANLLETLVPFFANPAVQLAYAPSYFMNQDGTQQVWSMAEYLSELGPERWSRPFVMTAPQIVREAFAEKNIIPNASSAVFRRHDRLEAMEIEVWRGMRTCGDWVFYLNQIRGGLLAYSPDAQNYYRQHPNNTSVTSFSKDSYYIEHETAAKTVQRHYSVEPNIFQRQYQRLVLHWTRHRTGFAQDAFDTCYSLARIQNEADKRKPKLLMVGYGFISGGGETFPITLANVMKTAGYDVTFLNCMQEPDIKGIRDQLAHDIPVVTRFEHLTTILADFDIDIVHSHHGWVDNTILNLLPEDSPTKTVVTLHGMYETMGEVQLKRILPRLVKRSGALVYTAMKNISALVSHGLVSPDDLPRIDNALAHCDINPVDRATLGIAPEAFVLVMVARAIPTKGWAEAIEAVGRARKLSGHDIHLVIVGDGPEHDRLVGTVASYIHLEGFRSNMRDYFAMGDMGFLPSRFKGESFPLVLIDCLQSGKPLIASDVGEVTYMLQSPLGPAGVTFALKKWQIPVDALAKQIAALAQDPELLKTLTDCVAEAARKFDPQLMRDRYDAVYEGLLQSSADRQAAE